MGWKSETCLDRWVQLENLIWKTSKWIRQTGRQCSGPELLANNTSLAFKRDRLIFETSVKGVSKLKFSIWRRLTCLPSNASFLCSHHISGQMNGECSHLLRIGVLKLAKFNLWNSFFDVFKKSSSRSSNLEQRYRIDTIDKPTKFDECAFCQQLFGFFSAEIVCR